MEFSPQLKPPQAVRKNASTAARKQALLDRLDYISRIAARQCTFVENIPWHDYASKTYHEMKRDAFFELKAELENAITTMQIRD